ncbi:hypothetical protein [Cysteiniphilum halobium]|uniref:hypothetical protein n=1 Tax=Cysteiniphilum halobium TaxID=2219059 RepID=UPI000E6488D1|nr:hypothetical protein [Cysteiniphilum halobium]
MIKIRAHLKYIALFSLFNVFHIANSSTTYEVNPITPPKTTIQLNMPQDILRAGGGTSYINASISEDMQRPYTLTIAEQNDLAITPHKCTIDEGHRVCRFRISANQMTSKEVSITIQGQDGQQAQKNIRVIPQKARFYLESRHGKAQAIFPYGNNQMLVTRTGEFSFNDSIVIDAPKKATGLRHLTKNGEHIFYIYEGTNALTHMDPNNRVDTFVPDSGKKEYQRQSGALLAKNFTPLYFEDGNIILFYHNGNKVYVDAPQPSSDRYTLSAYVANNDEFSISPTIFTYYSEYAKDDFRLRNELSLGRLISPTGEVTTFRFPDHHGGISKACVAKTGEVLVGFEGNGELELITNNKIIPVKTELAADINTIRRLGKDHFLIEYNKTADVGIVNLKGEFSLVKAPEKSNKIDIVHMHDNYALIQYNESSDMTLIKENGKSVNVKAPQNAHIKELIKNQSQIAISYDNSSSINLINAQAELIDIEKPIATSGVQQMLAANDQLFIVYEDTDTVYQLQSNDSLTKIDSPFDSGVHKVTNITQALEYVVIQYTDSSKLRLLLGDRSIDVDTPKSSSGIDKIYPSLGKNLLITYHGTPTISLITAKGEATYIKPPKEANETGEVIYEFHSYFSPTMLIFYKEAQEIVFVDIDGIQHTIKSTTKPDLINLNNGQALMRYYSENGLSKMLLITPKGQVKQIKTGMNTVDNIVSAWTGEFVIRYVDNDIQTLINEDGDIKNI